MPVLPVPSYRPPWWQAGAHLQTILPSLFRKVRFAYSSRERLELPDGDFVDLDWKFTRSGNPKLLIITHGLEGDSSRPYVVGMAKLFAENGYDVLGWNCRSCSGELNRLLRFYHHGDAGDLRFVIQHAIDKYGYQDIILSGFSMGGSLSLRAAGEFPDELPVEVKRVVAFSVPCDIYGSVVALNKPGNSIYKKRFLKKLGKKIQAKAALFSGQISYEGYDRISRFEEFDEVYTAPLHGFRDAFDFYAKASVRPLLTNIRIPTLIVQALNDPFLEANCFPYEEAAASQYVYLETPAQGGHCGFMRSGAYHSWAETRALTFASEEVAVT